MARETWKVRIAAAIGKGGYWLNNEARACATEADLYRAPRRGPVKRVWADRIEAAIQSGDVAFLATEAKLCAVVADRFLAPKRKGGREAIDALNAKRRWPPMYPDDWLFFPERHWATYAAGLRQVHPTMSEREIARRLEVVLGVKAHSVRRLIRGKERDLIVAEPERPKRPSPFVPNEKKRV